jgi:hypothetical protein
MAAAKDTKFSMVMTMEDKAMLAALAAVDDVSEAQVVRAAVRRSYLERFGDKKPKTKK